MAKRKMTPEEREQLRRDREWWHEVSREFAAMAERYHAKTVELRERRERRRSLIRRFLPFVRPLER